MIIQRELVSDLYNQLKLMERAVKTELGKSEETERDKGGVGRKRDPLLSLLSWFLGLVAPWESIKRNADPEL